MAVVAVSAIHFGQPLPTLVNDLKHLSLHKYPPGRFHHREAHAFSTLSCQRSRRCVEQGGVIKSSLGAFVFLPPFFYSRFPQPCTASSSKKGQAATNGGRIVHFSQPQHTRSNTALTRCGAALAFMEASGCFRRPRATSLTVLSSECV